VPSSSRWSVILSPRHCLLLYSMSYRDINPQLIAKSKIAEKGRGRCVITIPGIWKNPGAVYPIFRDIHIPGLFDDLVITNSGILKNHGMYFMLIFGMNSLMLHCI